MVLPACIFANFGENIVRNKTIEISLNLPTLSLGFEGDKFSQVVSIHKDTAHLWKFFNAYIWGM